MLLARQVSAEGRSRAFAGGAGVPATTLRRARRVAGRRARAERPAPAAAARRAARRARPVRRRRGARQLRAAFAERHARAARDRGRARRGRRAPCASGPGRPTCSASGSRRSSAVAPQPGEDAELAAEESRLGFADTLRAAAEQARSALSADDGAPDALGAVAAARRLLDGRPRPRPPGGRARRPARGAQLRALRPRRRRRVVRLGPGGRPGPAGRGLRAAGRAHRADPEVRRHGRRGAGLVREPRPGGCSSWRTPTGRSSGSAAGARSSAASWPSAARRCPRSAPRPPAGSATR